MASRKKIDPSIIEAAKQFNAKEFAEKIKGEFSDFPDHRYNQGKVVYPIWYILFKAECKNSKLQQYRSY